MLTIRNLEEDAVEDDWIGPAPWVPKTVPGPNAIEAIERDCKHTPSCYTHEYPLVVRRARGSVVEDVDGNRFLDFAAGTAVCATGHCHPLVVAAIREQAGKLIHSYGGDFHYEPMGELAERLDEIVPIKKPHRVYFTNSGAEAVEGAMKLARLCSGRKWLIGFIGGFHGRTMGALSLTSLKTQQKAGFGPLIPMVAHAEYGNVDDLENKLFKRQVPPDHTAAIFVEPVLGEGGNVVPPPEFLPRLRELCDKHGILLVFDEIQCGIGRTGKMFAFEHFGVMPDILLLAKGLASGMPLGAIIAPAGIMTWPPGTHGSTFGGNPVSCAAALVTLDLVKNRYMERAAAVGKVMVEKLRDIAARHRCVHGVRGLGLMIGVDIIKDKKTGRPDATLRDRITREAFQRGLILLGCGESCIRFCPPLCINQTQVEVGLEVFEETVATVSQ